MREFLRKKRNLFICWSLACPCFFLDPGKFSAAPVLTASSCKLHRHSLRKFSFLHVFELISRAMSRGSGNQREPSIHSLFAFPTALRILRKRTVFDIACVFDHPCYIPHTFFSFTASNSFTTFEQQGNQSCSQHSIYKTITDLVSATRIFLFRYLFLS